VPYPKADSYLKPVGRGATFPQLFDVEGIGVCVVKFLQNPQGLRALTNEFIGFKIASLLDIDHPETGILDVGAEVLPDGGVLKVHDEDDTYIFKPGLHFYSRWLEPADQVIATDLSSFGMADNPEILAGVVLLDLLLNNWDRKPLNLNLLLHRQGRHRLKLIDLSMAFGNANWTLGNLKDTDLP
jgi:hypothetical protein